MAIGDVIQSSVGAASHHDRAAGQPDRGQYQFGALQQGIVIDADVRNNTYTVETYSPSHIYTECQWLGGLSGALMGFNLNGSLLPGTGVLVHTGYPTVIVQVLASDPAFRREAVPRTSTAMSPYRDEVYPDPDGGFKGASIPTGGTHNHDQVPGEVEFTNQIGVFLQLLTHFAKLGAGERAKIECCVLNDMVRIVSDAFRHHTSFGDFEVYNDGRLNVRWNGTSYEHEAWGAIDADAPKVEVEEGQVKFDTVAETGRWRFSQFIGWLGDIVHQYITDPQPEQKGIVAQERAGKSHIWQGADGTILIQSVSDIVLERVHRVIVPIELKSWSDPEGQLSEEFDNLEKDPLTQWDLGPDWSKGHEAVYQLRCYARWLGQYHTLARFCQAVKDWEVKSESDAPEPSLTNLEGDVQEHNGPVLYMPRYSTIRIMRDGSQVLYDAYGNSYTSTQEGVSVTSTGRLRLQAAGDMEITAGGNIFMTARRSIDLVAVVGGIALKARTWLKSLCEWGSIYLKGNAYSKGSAWTPIDPATEQPRPTDPVPEILPYAVLIETEVGDIGIVSGRRIQLHATGEGLHEDEEAAAKTDPESVNSSILLTSSQDIRLHGARGIHMASAGSRHDGEVVGGMISMASRKSVQQVLEEAAISAALWTLNQQQIQYRRDQGELLVSKLRTRQIACSGRLDAVALRALYVQADSVSAGSVSDGASPSELVIETPDFHNPEPLLTEWRETKANRSAKLWGDDENRPPLWGFQAWSEYQQSPIYRSLSQQRLADDASMAALAWALADNQLKAAPGVTRVSTSQTSWPWPGRQAKEMVMETPTLPPLHELNTEAPADSHEQPAFTPTPYEFLTTPQPND